MRLFGLIVVISCVVGLLCAQSSSASPPYSSLWDREFSQPPNLYIPDIAVLDSHGVLWVLCTARMGNEGYRKQHVTEAIFRIDEQGQQLSTAELDLPLSQEERESTSDYLLAPLPAGEMGLLFNKRRYEARGESYLGAYYSTLGMNGSVSPLRVVAGPGPHYSELRTLANGDLLLGGSEGALFAFDREGAIRWKKSFQQPILVNPDSANLSDGSICLSAWIVGRQGVTRTLRVMQLDQRGNVLHTTDISNALRGQVAGGPDGSCAVLYDRAPSAYKSEYYLTVFDRSFSRQWTVSVRPMPGSGAEFNLVSLVDGYLAQIGNVLVEYSWSGKELWAFTETSGTIRTIAASNRDGFFVVTKGLHMNDGFHVKRLTLTNK